jgi:hypothetical protein
MNARWLEVVVAMMVAGCGGVTQPLTTGTESDASDESAAAHVAGMVPCGAQQCSVFANQCCAQPIQDAAAATQCAPTCKVGLPVSCDGPEDCTQGKICCAAGTNAVGYVSLECTAAPSCTMKNQVVCRTSADCPDAGRCTAVQQFTLPFRVCLD